MNTVKGQAKNALGFGPAVNVSKKGSDAFVGGLGLRMQGEVKIAKRVALVPSVGAEIPYGVYAGLSGKYYPVDKLHLILGGIAYIGGDLSGGIAPSIAVGYQILRSRRHFIDLDFHGEIIKVDTYENTTVLGLRLTYNFSFSKLK